MSIDEKINQLSGVFGWEMYAKKNDSITISDKLKNMPQIPGFLWGTLRADPWTKISLINGLTVPQAVETTNALQHYAVTHSKNHIPLLLAEEGAHGEMAISTTVFPTALGQASTWDTALIRQMAEAIAAETRSQGSNIVYAPILDLAREPRWSRVEETFGEDPELVGEMGVAVVRGLQNGKYKVISTLKHFTAYGMSDGGQNGGPVTLGKRDLLENILYPFHMAVAAGAKSIMASYNSIDGIPCSANPYLLTDILRKQWNFKGFVVSDLGSIDGLHSTQNIVSTPEAGAALSLKAGMDADLGGNGFGKNLKKAYDEKLISMSEIDTAVSRVLSAKFELGLFENPYADSSEALANVGSEAHIKIARKVADESIILLKNDSVNNKPLLPLSKDIKNIAVIGPNADNVYNQIGDYSAPQKPNAVVTVLKGIQNKLPNANIQYVKGCTIRDTTWNQIDEAVKAAQNADATVIVLGGSSARDFKTDYKNTGAAVVKDNEQHLSDMESGEGYDRTTLDLLGLQNKLLQAVVATGKPVVLVTIEGRPLNLNWAAKHVPAIVNAWYPGGQGGNAIADVLFGDYNPAGRLPVSYPRSVGQLPIYYNYQRPAKHRYVEEEATPLYPFGYGLSYSKFFYRNLSIENKSIATKTNIKVSFSVTNTSNIDGDEVPQLYIHQKYASTVRPRLQLRAFDRIHLKAGETKTVTFFITDEQLRNWTAQEKWEVEKGEYEILIGASSNDIRLKGSINL
ncbi:glycoside hydrolase family 3 N-terminal domain-containing protein [Arachidicoccus ginsenosidimutans]|uniref:glycoside hydrolase family 3 N-terminal domain-containing protein n=1 Tax=Arachidicoccus sp. BS20 TaxID=1850526 RepID=UPI0018D2D29C|nr:glycoside hydrolase family 3 N-terminal domain-containing protein [Arachidicoccus sp. BS20]